MRGYIGPVSAGGSATGDIDHFDRLLDLVLDVKGQPLMAVVRKRASFYISVRLGFHQMQC